MKYERKANKISTGINRNCFDMETIKKYKNNLFSSYPRQ